MTATVPGPQSDPGEQARPPTAATADSAKAGASRRAPLRPETLAVHATFSLPVGSVPGSAPIYQTSLFTFEDPETFADAWSRPDGAFAYSRLGNPTTRALEDVLSTLERGHTAVATSSGMGAISAVLFALLRSGDHVIVQGGVYGGTLALLRDMADRWGIEVTRVSGLDSDELSEAVRATSKLLFLETIANPMGQVCDLGPMCAAAQAAGLVTIVDNTFATPMLCRPIEHGADIVVHSTTKYIGGHADVVGGVVVVADAAHYGPIWRQVTELGVSPDPFASWLTLRGLQTLALRVRRQCDTAELLARRLDGHERVRAVHHAGLPSSPSYGVARRILSGCGGVLAFDVDGGLEDALAMTRRLNLVSLAPSLGGVSTTILHPATTSHSQLSSKELHDAGIGDTTLRVACGLEHPEDLWSDLAQALLGRG